MMNTDPVATNARPDLPTQTSARLGLAVAAARESRLLDWFIRRHASDGRSADAVFDEWLGDDSTYMLRILGETGVGKSTLKDHLFLRLAEGRLRSDGDRTPLELEFADAVNAVTMPAAGKFAVADFEPGNSVIFVDGYEGQVTAFGKAADIAPGTKVVVFQRETLTLPVPTVTRLRRISPIGDGCRTMWLRLSLEETRRAVDRFFPIALERSGASCEPQDWKDERLSALLSGAFDGLLIKPAMAHHLCKIAADPCSRLEWNPETGAWIFSAHRAPTHF